MKIKVVYETRNGILPELDKKIRDAMEGIGLHWYAEGITLADKIHGVEERDICFDAEV